MTNELLAERTTAAKRIRTADLIGAIIAGLVTLGLIWLIVLPPVPGTPYSIADLIFDFAGPVMLLAALISVFMYATGTKKLANSLESDVAKKSLSKSSGIAFVTLILGTIVCLMGILISLQSFRDTSPEMVMAFWFGRGLAAMSFAFASIYFGQGMKAHFVNSNSPNGGGLATCVTLASVLLLLVAMGAAAAAISFVTTGLRNISNENMMGGLMVAAIIASAVGFFFATILLIVRMGVSKKIILISEPQAQDQITGQMESD